MKNRLRLQAVYSLKLTFYFCELLLIPSICAILSAIQKAFLYIWESFGIKRDGRPGN
jgi:hypothetical protein